jgi:hypothetical protein
MLAVLYENIKCADDSNEDKNSKSWNRTLKEDRVYQKHPAEQRKRGEKYIDEWVTIAHVLVVDI